MLSSSVPPSSNSTSSHTPLPQHPLHRGLPGQVSQGPHISYEGRVSVLPNSGYGMPALPQHFQQNTPFSANLNLNLFNSSAFKAKEDNDHQTHPFNFPFTDRDSSPSSTESPRTSNDDQPHDGSLSNYEESPTKPIREMSEDNVASPEDKSDDIPPLQFIKEAVEKTEVDLSILRPVVGNSHEHEESITEEEEPLEVPPPKPWSGGLEIRPIGDLVIDDRKRKREEDSIDLEMEEEANDSMNDSRMNESGEERNESMEKSSEGNEEHNWKPFQGFQPYLNVKDEDGSGPASALEKLQQVLDSRMFEGRKGPAANSGEGGEVVEQPSGEDSEYKFILPPDEEGMVYQCHICSYTGNSRFNFNIHVNTHYDFQCAKCDFEDKSEQVYCKHLRDEHNCAPEDLEEAEIRTPRVNSQGKVKTFKCKQCEFVAVTKIEFWNHCRGHIKPEKMLFCPKCIFVTEYKHHLEYHLRNHYGAKPFKCSHCNYSCVNKSMLNSHMKSHTNVYQYRCADCTYATKYCHSLKLHLRKYSHKPAMVLNNDGSPNPLPVIDAFGNRRGPKSKKGEEGGLFPPSLLPNFPSPFSMPSMAQLQQLQQNMNGNSLKIAQVHPFSRMEPESRPLLSHERPGGMSPSDISSTEEQLRCDKCEFKTSSREVYKNHMMLHESMQTPPAPNNNMSALHHLLSQPLPPRHHPDLNRSRDEMSSSPGGTFSPKQPSPASPRPSFLSRSFSERPESPSSSSPHLPKLPQLPQLPPHLSYLNRFAMAQPFLKNLMPNPAIQALMEGRGQLPQSSPEPLHLKSESPEIHPVSPPQSPPRTEAPLPPNKRSRQDIFAALYESRLSEMREKQEQGVLDLSKEQGPLGGGSHGSSSSEIDSGSNPRSHSSSPALSSTNSQEQKGKNRRKGKAFKITREMIDNSDEEVTTSASPAMPSLMAIPKHALESSQEGDDFPERTTCQFCGIAFKNAVMYTIHMGYHGYQSPFKCNMCGEENADPVSFFLHIARREHQ